MLGKHPAIDYKLTLNETFFIFRLCLHYYIPKGSLKVVILLPWLPRQLRLQVCVPSLCLLFHSGKHCWLARETSSLVDRTWFVASPCDPSPCNWQIMGSNFRVSPCRHDNWKAALWTSNWTHLRDHMESLPVSIIKFPFILYPLCHNIDW